MILAIGIRSNEGCENNCDKSSDMTVLGMLAVTGGVEVDHSFVEKLSSSKTTFQEI